MRKLGLKCQGLSRLPMKNTAPSVSAFVLADDNRPLKLRSKFTNDPGYLPGVDRRTRASSFEVQRGRKDWRRSQL